MDVEAFESSAPLHPMETDLSQTPLISVARFTNAAEAGYFAHELTQVEQIPVQLKLDEHFDALSGCWSARFILDVPEKMAEAATVALRQIVESNTDDDLYEAGVDEPALAYDDARSPPPEDAAAEGIQTSTSSGVNWIPIVLTLTAGSVAFWSARRMNDKPRVEPRKAAVPVQPAGPHEQDLWEHLSNSPEPWTQRSKNSPMVRELRFHRQKQQAVLRVDADGDGVFEKEFPVERRGFH